MRQLDNQNPRVDSGSIKGNKPSTADDVLGEDDVKEAEKK